VRVLAAVLGALLTALACGDAAADPPPDVLDLAAASRPAIRVFRDRDGLPENAPLALALDPRGVLWTGTEDGLASYDGRAFRTFNAPKREVSNYFRAVYPDATGAVWCGLQDGGLARLEAGRWTTFEGAGLPSERVDAITESVAPGGGRAIWLATLSGVARKDRDRWTVLDAASGLPSPHVGVLLDGRDEGGAPALYAGTAKGLAISHGEGFALVDGAPTGPISALYQSSDECTRELWVGMYGRGAARRAGGAWTVFGKEAGLPETSVRAITQTREPGGACTTWLATDAGLVRFDGQTFRPELVGALPSTTVWSLLAEPRRGPTHTLWVGVDGGLVRVRLGGFRSLPGEAAASSVYAIQVTEDAAGEALWLGTRGGGLQRFDGKSWTRIGGRSGLPDETVYAIAELDEGEGKRSVWVGGQTGWVARYADGAWTKAFQGTATVRQIHPVTAADGSPALDVATGNRGVLRMAHGTWSYVSKEAGLPTEEVFDVTETRVAPGSPSVMWVATDGAGIARREGEGPWRVFDRKTSGLLSDSVLALHVVRDAAGKDVALWAGTQGGGASVLDLRDAAGTFQTFTEASSPAIPNDTVYDVQDDGHGDVFLFTNKGVARLTPRSATPEDPSPFVVRTFTTEDGLPANECNSGGAFVDGRGRIWAGTVAGVAFFDPRAEVKESAAAAIDLVPRLARSEALLLPEAELAYDRSGVAFDYVLPRLFRGAETLYRTQLVGLEPSPGPWTLEARHEYPSLPAGSYVFRVWSRDFEGREAAASTKPFRVRPPPWLTWWAGAIYTLVLAAAAYGIARYRAHALEVKNALLETKIAERTVALARKVGELAVSEARARAAEEDARRADRTKSLFLSTMSHELRTPLNAILGFSQLLVRDRALSRSHQEDVEVIQRSGEHLLGLINDVLSIAKIEAGMVVLESRAFRLEDTVRAAAKIVLPRARAKGLQLTTEIAPGMPPAVRGDDGKLRQILLNLLGNAVKFTTRGSVGVKASWTDGRAILEVTDTGPGIAPAELATLFAPFVQSEAGRAASEGTGLGLAISRSYAQRMKGDVTATSSLGVGTTFRCEVALEAAAEADAAPPDRRVTGLAPGSGPYRALLVDDSAENRRLLARLLAMDGLEVREVKSGDEAVEAWESFAPDVIFMDVHMKGMDGAAATRAIRAAEGAAGAGGAERRRPTKIVAISASVVDTDRDALLAGGCDAFVSKPYREALLFDTLETLLGARFLRAKDSGGMRTDVDVATPERLGRLPGPLRDQLYRAARGGDLGAAREAVEIVATKDEELAASLRMLVDAFLLEEIEARMSHDGSRPGTA
jgi:signal transduction histidine kinase/CheY-like chemotaxis protein/ligand-binding sensor domain-containing protein